MHSSVNKDRSKREMVSVVQMRKGGKGLAKEFRVLHHHLHCLYDRLRNAYRGDGKCGIEMQNGLRDSPSPRRPATCNCSWVNGKASKQDADKLDRQGKRRYHSLGESMFDVIRCRGMVLWCLPNNHFKGTISMLVNNDRGTNKCKLRIIYIHTDHVNPGGHGGPGLQRQE